jgi:hypothetical protein
MRRSGGGKGKAARTDRARTAAANTAPVRAVRASITVTGLVGASPAPPTPSSTSPPPKVPARRCRKCWERSSGDRRRLWAAVNEEVEVRLAAGTSRMRPQDWKSGDRLWVVEVIAPFGGAEEMVKDLKAKVFAEREMRFLAAGKEKEISVI